MAKSQVMNFTILSIESLPIPLRGRAYYHDSIEDGLSLYVTPHGTKTFFIRKRVRGRDERIILGSPKTVPVDNARKQARIIKDQIADGLDPIAEKRKSLGDLTLGEHFNSYMELYSKIHKKSWKQDEREIPKYLSHWFDRKLIDITRYEIQKLHQAAYVDHGLYQANRIVQRLKAMYNKAIEWGWVGINPAAKIKLYKQTSRDRFILPHEMPHLVQALNSEYNETARDVLWILLLTGVRKTNALQMQWKQINWEHQTWRIPDTKSGDPLILPLLDRAIEILRNRQATSKSEWVFPSETNPAKHFVNVKRAWKRNIQNATISFWAKDDRFRSLVEECRANIPMDGCNEQWFNLITETAKDRNIILPLGLMDVRLHDIRRTFGSYQAITGSSLTIIGKSLGHKSQTSTQVYARLNLDPVRASIEKALNAMIN